MNETSVKIECLLKEIKNEINMSTGVYLDNIDEIEKIIASCNLASHSFLAEENQDCVPPVLVRQIKKLKSELTLLSAIDNTIGDLFIEIWRDNMAFFEKEHV